MKTMPAPPIGDETAFWAPITKLPQALHCSITSLHKWGKEKEFGYKQVGPRLILVCVPEVLAFYTSKYPNIEIDYEAIDALMECTA